MQGPFTRWLCREAGAGSCRGFVARLRAPCIGRACRRANKTESTAAYTLWNGAFQAGTYLAFSLETKLAGTCVPMQHADGTLPVNPCQGRVLAFEIATAAAAAIVALLTCA